MILLSFLSSGLWASSCSLVLDSDAQFESRKDRIFALEAAHWYFVRILC